MTVRAQFGKVIAIHLFAALGGWLLSLVNAPLPWMIGPLLFTAALYISGYTSQKLPLKTRPYAQLVVAVQVGLAFSPAALAAVFSSAPLLVGMALVTAVCSSLAALVLSRLSGMPLVQALLSTIPASPVEAAVLAEQLGAERGPVTLAQTLRITSVVLLIPLALYVVEGWPDRAAPVATAAFDPLGLLRLVVAAVIGARLFLFLRLANPYFLGPLSATAAITAFGVVPAPFPFWVLGLAQIVLGTWLGSSFRPELFKAAGRLIGALILSTALCLLLATSSALLVAHILELPWETLVLGSAPGGVTEMALTAKFLGLDVAFITACQLVRIFLIIPALPFIASMIHRMETRGHR